jgi:hypothetical protein
MVPDAGSGRAARAHAPFGMRPIGRRVGRLGWLQCWNGRQIGAIVFSLGVRVAFQRQ